MPTLVLFGPGLIFFTTHYLILRGFYAREENRTVFYIQCVVAATNVVVALVAVHFTSDQYTAPALVGAYTASYAVGSVVSYRVLSKRLGGLHTPIFIRFGVRLIAAVAVATATTWLMVVLVPWLHTDADIPGSLIKGGVLAVAFLAVYLVAARALRIYEVTDLVSTFSRRVRR